MPFYATIIAFYFLATACCGIEAPAMHRITYYYPFEDYWGNAVADPEIMRHGDPGIESWDMNWCAVNDKKRYPFGTLIYIEDIGFKFVHDHCPMKNTIDIRVPYRRMERHYKRVWVIFRQEK